MIRLCIRVFSFVIAVILVNSYLVFVYFNNRSENIVQYYKLLMYEICFNTLDAAEGTDSVASPLASTRRIVQYSLVKVPKFGKFVNSKCIRAYKVPYQQYRCST